MNKEEIKEILEELENMYEISELEEQVNNINKIRDYIINLQQENQELHNKIDKAIEYIESKEYQYGDEEPKKIEKIKSNGDEFYSDYIDAWISKNKTDAYCEFLMNKINELIDEINNLKEK